MEVSSVAKGKTAEARKGGREGIEERGKVRDEERRGRWGTRRDSERGEKLDRENKDGGRRAKDRGEWISQGKVER